MGREREEMRANLISAWYAPPNNSRVPGESRLSPVIQGMSKHLVRFRLCEPCVLAKDGVLGTVIERQAESAGRSAPLPPKAR